MVEETAVHRALAAPTRARVLEVLGRTERPLGVLDIAGQVGVHPNTVRFHLRLLERAGLVDRRPRRRQGRGRPRLLFVARPGPAGNGYRLLAEALVAYLAGEEDAQRRSREAGRGWGVRLARSREATRGSLAGVVAVLGELGFQPEPESGPRAARVLLHACPFRRVAEAHPEVVCSLHLGVIRGLLEAWGSDLRADSLEPFVGPELCVATLRGSVGGGP